MKRGLLFVLMLALVSSLAFAGGAPEATTTTSTAAASKDLAIAISENILKLDPHDANNVTSYQIRNMCFDPLIESDHAGNFTPCLAESYEVSEGGKVITFHLRKNVKWQDGTDFTADDVVCTFQRLIDDRSLAVSSTYWSLLVSVEKIDDYTVKINLSDAYAPILSSLSVTMMIQKAQWEKYGANAFNNQSFVGTGPWKFVKWVDGQYASFQKNEDYWGDFDSYYDNVTLNIILEPSTAIAAHRNGDVQAYIASSGIAPDNLTLYSGTENKIELINIDTGSIMYIGFQCGEKSPFHDKNVRLAFAHAVNRQAIADYIFSGHAIVPDSFAAKGVIGHTDKAVHYEYNPELAKQYLAKSNYDGREIVLLSNTGTAKSQEVLLAIVDNLKEVGFNASMQIVESAVLSEVRATGNYDAFMVTSMQENGEPYKYLNMRVRTDAHHGFFLDEEMNQWILESNSEMDPATRRALLEKIVARFSENLFHFPVVQLSSTYAADYGVTGLGLYADGIFNFKYVTHN